MNNFIKENMKVYKQIPEFCIYTNNSYPLVDYGNGLLNIGNNIDGISTLSHFCIFDVNKKEYILNIQDIDSIKNYAIISTNKNMVWTISINNELITTNDIDDTKCLWNIFYNKNSKNIYFKNVYNNMFLCKDGFIGLFKNYQFFVNRENANYWEQFKIVKL